MEGYTSKLENLSSSVPSIQGSVVVVLHLPTKIFMSKGMVGLQPSNFSIISFETLSSISLSSKFIFRSPDISGNIIESSKFPS